MQTYLRATSSQTLSHRLCVLLLVPLADCTDLLVIAFRVHPGAQLCWRAVGAQIFFIEGKLVL